MVRLVKQRLNSRPTSTRRTLAWDEVLAACREEV
jgi:hypothetical protein